MTLLNATLHAANPTTPYPGGAIQTINASVYPVTSSWTLSTTWQTRDGITNWTAPGGDFDVSYRRTTPVDYSSDGYADADVTWNITDLVRQWYLGTRPNNGLMIKADDESFFSLRYLEADDGVSVTYSYVPWIGGAAPGGARAFDPHAALKTDRNLITFPQGDGQQLGVNAANGDLEIMRNDVSIPSPGIPNVVQRTYHSLTNANTATALGPGWQLSVGADSSVTTLPTGDVAYVDPTGRAYDIPRAGTASAPAILTDTTTQGNWVGTYGGDGYILNGWAVPFGIDIISLPSYASGARVVTGTNWGWQSGTTDRRALYSPDQTSRNAAMLFESAPPTQTQQVVTFNARTLITASVYLLNWGPRPVSKIETVQVQDASGIHSYRADGRTPGYDNGLWVRYANLQVGPTQPLTITITGEMTITGGIASVAVSSGLMFDGGTPNNFLRAQGLPADLTQNADGSYNLTFNTGLTEHFSASGQYTSASERHGLTEQFTYGGGTGGSCPSTLVGSLADTVGRTTTFGCSGNLVTSITDPKGRGVSYGYGAKNYLTSFTDRANGVTLYGYNASNQLTTVTDPINHQTVITYNTAGQVGAVQTSDGSVTSFTFVTSTNMTTVTNPLGKATVYTYDPLAGSLVSITDPNHNTTSFTFDGNGLLQTTTDPLGHVITNTTTSGSNQTSSTDALGLTTSAIYNALNLPTTITDPQGSSVTSQYNAVGDLITVTDPLSYTTIYTHNTNGATAAMQDGNGHVTRYGHDAFGDTTVITDALGRSASMGYDTAISRLSSTQDAKGQTTSLTYDGEDRGTLVTYQGGGMTRVFIDADGNITQTVDSTGVTSYQRDAANRLTQQTSPDGTVVIYTYDAVGRLKTKTEPGMPVVTYVYDDAGRLMRIDNAVWGPIAYTYDAANHLTALGYPNGVTTTYQYDGDSRPITVTEQGITGTLFSDTSSYAKPGGGTWGLRSTETTTNQTGGVTWNYNYDAASHLTGASSAANTFTYGYDAVGNMTTTNSTSLSYDAVNQLTAAGPITYSFDLVGNQTATSASTTPRWTYDAQNHTQAFTSTQAALTLATTAGGQRAQKSGTVSGSSFANTFDAEIMGLSLVRQTAPLSATTYYERDPGGRLLALIGPTTTGLFGVSCPSTTSCYAVGNKGVIVASTDGGTTWTPQNTGATTTLLHGLACPSTTTCYAVGDAGTVLATTNSGTTWTAQTSGTTSALYGVACPNTTTCYAVGVGGAIRATTNSGATWTAQTSGTSGTLYGVACPSTTTCYAVGAGGIIRGTANSGTTWTAQTSGTTNTLTAVACPSAGLCYTAGAAGTIRTTTDNGMTWVAQTSGTTTLLHGLGCVSGATTCYAVGDAGTVLATTNSGTTWTAQTSGTTMAQYGAACATFRLCATVGLTGTIQTTTSAGGTWTPHSSGQFTYYYGHDVHGSTATLTDRWGTVVNTYSYAPYGASLAKAETALVANPWQYAGGFYNSESGLYLMGARYYDPSIGRFLQQDPLGGGGSSQYAYASGDPCNNGDPSGLTTCYHYVSSSTIAAGISAVVEEAGAMALAAIGTGAVGGVLIRSSSQ